MGDSDALRLPGEKRELRVLVDTSSWMHEHADTMLERFFIPVVLETGQKLVVPVQVVEEVQRHLEAADPVLRGKAERADDLLRRYRAMGLADFFGGSEKTFTDNVIQMVITRFCEKYHFCLVTQDRALAADTLRLGHRASVSRSKSIIAVRVGQRGGLDRWELDPSHPKGAIWHEVEAAQYAPRTRQDGAPEPKRFRLCSGAPRADPRVLGTSSPISEGSILVDSTGNPIRLGEKLGAGGEGAVYATDKGLVCKVYEGSRLTAGTREKISLMVQHPVRHAGICWPRSITTNDRGEFVGYLMERAQGRELQRTIFIKPLLERAFPNWGRVELVALAASILESIRVLHERNVLLGDINPLNILVADEKSVFFVDTDSYQVEDFACPVGTATFLPPDLLGRNLASILRDFTHERFAVATLVFMLLMPGKPPYSHAGGGDPAENVRRRHFPYGLAEKRGKGVPAGPWRFMWSHLPFYMKEVFHDVFVDGARPTTEDWLDIMHRYYNDLTRGHVSNEIFPTTFKRLKKSDVIRKGGTWQACSKCGGEFGQFDRTDGPPLCPECQNEETRAKCFLCEREFVLRMSQMRRAGGREPICHECRVHSQTRQCRMCGQAFEITATDHAFFKRKGLSLPKNCTSCRRQKRTGTVLPPGTVSPAPTTPSTAVPAPAAPKGESVLDMLARWLKF